MKIQLFGNSEQLLQGSGCVSHEEAMEHATTEYRKYKQRTISDVERDYLFSIKTIENSAKKKKIKKPFKSLKGCSINSGFEYFPSLVKWVSAAF